jgi:hypothetical protein
MRRQSRRGLTPTEKRVSEKTEQRKMSGFQWYEVAVEFRQLQERVSLLVRYYSKSQVKNDERGNEV